jgi:hypothetical protein
VPVRQLNLSAASFARLAFVPFCRLAAAGRPATSLVANEILKQQLRALTGAERRLVEAVLIHKHRARLSPRVIPGPSQFVALRSASKQDAIAF